MKNFNFEGRTEIIFGKNSESVIADALERRGATRVLVCYGRESVIKSGILERTLLELKKVGIEYDLHGGIGANPLRSVALEGVDIAATHESNFVLAIGGGSVIDAAKCIAAGAKNKDIWQFYLHDGEPEFGAEITDALPVGVVLTLPAAGSEGSTHSVIRDDETGLKYGIGSEFLRPVFAVINPEYCLTLPRFQIAYGASDILAHLMERYFSPQENVVLTDRLLGGAINAMLEIAPKLYKSPTKYEYWAEFCLLGTLAHNGMLDMGREIQDWATHAIENNIISGVFNHAHGEGLAILFPAWLKHVAKTKPQKIEQFTREVLGAASVAAGIKKLEDFYKSLGLPATLQDAKINPDEAVRAVKAIFPEDVRLGGYGQLGLDDIVKIVESCGGGK